jgi:cell filamentation protein
MKKKIETLAELEKLLTDRRVRELQTNPPPAEFNVETLRATHAYIFQDYPKYDLATPKPGEFRHYVHPAEGDWAKNRALVAIPNGTSVVCYSPMAENDLKELESVLKEAQPARLKKLPTKEFGEAISKLYAKLDYIHPFYEGNSRTLRTFTRQIARASGYRLEWEKFNQSEAARDFLYIARDRAVGELAVNHIRRDSNLRLVVFSMDKYAGNPPLSELIASITRPARATYFEKVTEQRAIKAYPELEQAFKTLHAASEYFAAKLPGNAKAQAEAMKQTRQYIQGKLDAGAVSDFHRPSKEKPILKTPEKPAREADQER